MRLQFRARHVTKRVRLANLVTGCYCMKHTYRHFSKHASIRLVVIQIQNLKKIRPKIMHLKTKTIEFYLYWMQQTFRIDCSTICHLTDKQQSVTSAHSKTLSHMVNVRHCTFTSKKWTADKTTDSIDLRSNISNLSRLPTQESSEVSLLNDKYNSDSDCRNFATLQNHTISTEEHQQDS